MSTDDLMSWDSDGTALVDFEFCLVTKTLEEDYPFKGILGFGKPGTDKDAIYGTFVGKMYDQLGYDPVATFDVGFESSDSAVTVGYFTPNSDTNFDLGTALSVQGIDQWAIMVDSVGYNSFEQTNDNSKPAVLALEFPYIAIPSKAYDSLHTDLTSLGFLCFRQPFEATTYCQTSKDCGEVVSNLYNVELVTAEYDTITITPSMYLKTMDDH